MTTYYRIAAKPMTEADCHDRHVSRMWTGEGNERAGVSVCGDYDDLLTYFAGGARRGPFVGAADGVSLGRGAKFRGAYLVELEGEDSGDAPWETDCGERLVHPTRILSCDPIEETSWSEDLVERVDEILRALCWDGRAVYRAGRIEIVEDVDAE